MKMSPAPIGKTFGWWIVIGDAEPRNHHAQWLCRCKCGSEVAVDAYTLKSGKSKSCGCFLIENPAHLTHGLRHTVIYQIWCGLLTRCYNSHSEAFPRYGGRGIAVCEFIRSSPANLLTILGERPSPQLSIGRIQNDGHYSCGICSECLQREWPLNMRWETAKQQARNRCSNRMVTIDGLTKSLAQWAEDSGIKYRAFEYRVNHGLDPFIKP